MHNAQFPARSANPADGAVPLPPHPQHRRDPPPNQHTDKTPHSTPAHHRGSAALPSRGPRAKPRGCGRGGVGGSGAPGPAAPPLRAPRPLRARSAPWRPQRDPQRRAGPGERGGRGGKRERGKEGAAPTPPWGRGRGRSGRVVPNRRCCCPRAALSRSGHRGAQRRSPPLLILQIASPQNKKITVENISPVTPCPGSEALREHC